MAKKKTSTGKGVAKRPGTAKRKKASGPARKTKAAPKKPVGKKSVGKKAVAKKAASQKGVKKKLSSKKKPAVKKKTALKKKAAAKTVGKKKTGASKKTRTKKTGTKKKTGAKVKAAAKKSVVKRAAPKRAALKRAVASKAVRKKTARRTEAASKVAAKKPVATSSPPVEEAYVEPPVPKTRLSDEHLRTFKEMLLEKRRALAGDVRTLTSDALGRSRQDSSGDLSSMPIHMADLGTDNWEQDFTLGLIANEQKLVREIDEALKRVENRTYGVCLSTHKPITLARLRAKPWAKYCIEYARTRELGRH